MVGRTKITSDTAALRVDHLEEQSTVTSQTAALGIDRRLGAAGIVHELLNDMIDPALQGKQAHWNLQRRIEDRQVVDRGVARLHAIAEVGWSRRGSLGELDLASQNLVIQVLDGIEKKLWIFEAQRPTEVI